MKSNTFFPGIGGVNDQLVHGIEDGDIWLPGEVDTSIRPGWFYHESEDDRVKSPDQLIDIWYHSVGMNGNLILNLPVDRRGLIHENDIASLKGLKKYIDNSFSVNLAPGAEITATKTRRPVNDYSAEKSIDNDPETFWSTPDDVTTASAELAFIEPASVNAILLQEYIVLGQRVKSFKIEALDAAGNYYEIASGTTIGNRRIVPFGRTETSSLRITFEGKASLAISNIEVYNTSDNK
jgi:alpha-L-fucosidase